MLALLVLLILGLGCDRGPAPSSTAAHLGSQTLTASRLAEILVLSQPLPLETDVATELAREWLNVSVVASRVASGDSLMTPDLVDAATWLDRRTSIVDAWVGRHVPEPARRAAAIADSVYAAGDIRMFAHIFKRVGPETRPEEKALQRSALERIRNALIGGGAWREANRESDDEASRSAGGIIGLVRRGDLVPEFERAAFSLQPGQLSPVVETRYGFHIIHRPTLPEVRSLFIDRLAREMSAESDSAFADSLLDRHAMRPAGGAAASVRTVARDPWTALGSTTVVAEWDGGAFTEDELARYLAHYPAESRNEMTEAPDSVIAEFLKPLAFESMVAVLAERDGIMIPDSQVATIRESYVVSLDDLLMAARLRPADLADVSADTRGAEAARRVDVYLEAVAARRETLHPVPPLLAARLLGGVESSVNPAGIERAIARARQLVEAAGGER